MPDFKKPIIKMTPSPNRGDAMTKVEFMILHYTAVTLEETLAITFDPGRRVSAHLVVDTNGDIYETVPCLDGKAFRAWHAGKSSWTTDKTWEDFNSFAIGVEIVNLNGQIFHYTDAQYEALQEITMRLKDPYPALRAPERVLGHEHIAGFRGKADPGILFDWHRFFTMAYPGTLAPVRNSICPAALQEPLTKLKTWAPTDAKAAAGFWSDVSLLTETLVKIMHEK